MNYKRKFTMMTTDVIICSDMKFNVIEKIFETKNKEIDLKVKKEIINSLKFYESNKDDTFHKRKLVNSYWKLVRYLILNSIPDNFEEQLQFSEEAEWVINFGYISKTLSNEIDIEDYSKISFNSKINFGVEVLFLTSFFKKKYREFIEISGHDRLKERLNNIKVEHGRETIRLILLEKEREELTKELIDDNDNLNQIKFLNRKISEILKELIYKKLYYGRGNSNYNEERNYIINLEETLKTFYKEKEGIYRWENIGKRGLSKKIRDIDNIIKEKIKRIEELKVEQNKSANDFITLVNEENDMSKEKIQAYFDELLKKIQTISRIIIKGESSNISPCLSNKFDKNIIKTVEKIIDLVYSMDIDIFNNCRVKYNSKPDIIFLPGMGSSFYHDSFNSIFLPLSPIKDLEYSLITSFGRYKWKMDDIHFIRKNYSSLDKNNFLNNLKLEEKFSKEYYYYITTNEECDVSNESIKWFKEILCRPKIEKNEKNKLNSSDEIVESTFNLRIAEFYKKLNNILKIEKIEELIEFSFSKNGDDLIDIKIKGIDPSNNGEIEKILNALIIQAKLKRFSILDVRRKK